MIDIEGGTPVGVSLTSFGLARNYSAVRDAIAALANDPHGFKTLIIDFLDALEGLVVSDACQINSWSSIEDPGFGKGHVILDRWWRDVLSGCNWLRIERTMTIVLLAHSGAMLINDPRLAVPYTSYGLRIYKRAAALVLE